MSVPRIAPGELALYRWLGWVPWILGILLLLSWEGVRFLSRPSRGVRFEAALALGLGVARALASWFFLSVQAREYRELHTLVVGEGRHVLPPVLVISGTIGLTLGVVFLALRLRLARRDGWEPEDAQ